MRSSTTRQPAPPSPLPGVLEEWVGAGLITPEQSLSIQQHEAGSHRRGAALAVARPGHAGPSLVVEALGYLGGVVMTAGAMILVGLYWSDLSVALRLVIVGMTACALVATGFAVPEGLGEAAARLRSVLWAAGVVATAGFFTVLADQVMHRYDEDALIVLGPATAVVAAVLWRLHRTWLQQLALLVPVLLSAVAVALQVSDADSTPGVAVWSLAVTWAALAWLGWVPPRVSGVAFGAVGAVFGSLTVHNDLGIALALLTAVATVVLALWERSLPWLGVGAVATLYASPRAAVEWFPGPLSAALTLIVTGGALLGAAFWVARHRDGDPAASERG